jgi:hypothetical protein
MGLFFRKPTQRTSVVDNAIYQLTTLKNLRGLRMNIYQFPARFMDVVTSLTRLQHLSLRSGPLGNNWEKVFHNHDQLTSLEIEWDGKFADLFFNFIKNPRIFILIINIDHALRHN